MPENHDPTGRWQQKGSPPLLHSIPAQSSQFPWFIIPIILLCVFLEDNECNSSMEQWDQYKLLVFVFSNIDSVDVHVYPVSPLTCTEVVLSLKVCGVCVSSVHTVLMKCFHVYSIITLAPGFQMFLSSYLLASSFISLISHQNVSTSRGHYTTWCAFIFHVSGVN